MGIERDLAAFAAKLDAAIIDVMKLDAAEAVRAEMSKHLEDHTYTRSRGPSGMGVRDRRNFLATVEQVGDTTTLRVRDVAPFQADHSGGKSLAEVVETGDPTYRMPGPRPFMRPTQEIMDEGAAESVFFAGMAKRGFTHK